MIQRVVEGWCQRAVEGGGIIIRAWKEGRNRRIKYKKVKYLDVSHGKNQTLKQILYWDYIR